MQSFSSILLIATSLSSLRPSHSFFASSSGSGNRLVASPEASTQRTLLQERVWGIHDSETRPESEETEITPPSIVGGGVGEATSRLGKAKPTVWTEFARLAQENNVVNLGQGFPDWLPPKFAVDSLVEAALDAAQSPHQYTRPAGHPALVKQLARRYTAHLRHEIDPMAEVAVTVGASQALYLSLQTIVGPGDEVVLFEPFFDLYVNQVKLAGATPVFVPLRFVPYDESGETITGGEWVLDAHTLKKSVNQKTKAIILNSPHNPTGKIFSRDEMENVAEALELANPDCVVLSDEVYKYIVHSPPKERAPEESLFCRGHVHFASLPGMWDRTITISSAGKTFSATGWQVGWCIGPRHLIARIHQLLPYVQFCASTVIQEALARSLPRADEPYEGHASYYDYLRKKYTQKRDILATGLRESGFAVPDYSQTPGGGFFIFARIGQQVRDSLPPERIDVPNPAAPSGIARQDWALCEWMAEEKGVLCIPSAPFFSEARVGAGASEEFVRVAFCKSDETLEAAADVLSTIVSKFDQSVLEESVAFQKRQGDQN